MKLASTTDISVQAVPGGKVTRLPADRTLRAYELLASQPATLANLPKSVRDRVVVTAVVDIDGVEHAASRLGDKVWDLHSIWTTQNDQPSMRYIKWPDDLPDELLDDAKAALYAWLKRGRKNAKRPNGKTLHTAVRSGIPTLRYLASKGVRRFADVHPIHLSDLVNELGKTLNPVTIRIRMTIVDLAWDFGADLMYPLRSHPWGGRNLGYMCGVDDSLDKVAGRRGKTPVIPQSVQSVLFNYAEACLNDASARFAARDAGDISPEGHRLKELRNAVLYLLQVTSGMRNNEAVAVKRNSWRVETRDGHTYHWVATTETKTGKGAVEFLVPPETITALELLQQYAEPLQARLAEEISILERQLSALEDDPQAITTDGMTRVDILQRLAVARGSIDNLFLGRTVYATDGSGKGSRIEVMSVMACGFALKQLATNAGTKWKLNNHQCRRTFAWTVANSRLGRWGLVFVKWQLKHSSINMSQLYAANPRQDASLYDEFYEEIVAAQTEVLESWFDHDQALAGGGGRKIMQTRAIAIKDRQSLLRHTAEHIKIRSTGHSWCLAEQSGCVGEGIYEAIRCGSCSAGVIDQSHSETWKNIHRSNLQLATVADCGPVVAKRAAREIATSEAILKDLGISVPV